MNKDTNINFARTFQAQDSWLTKVVRRATGLPSSAQLVLTRMAAEVGSGRVFAGSQERIGSMCGLSRSTVVRALKCLEELGWIVRSHFYRKSGRRGVDRIKISIPKIRLKAVPRKSLCVTATQPNNNKPRKSAVASVFKRVSDAVASKITISGGSSAKISPAKRVCPSFGWPCEAVSLSEMERNVWGTAQ